MLREFKFLRRNSIKNSSADEAENVAPNPRDLPAVHAASEVSRDPLNSIQDPSQNPNPGQGPASGTKGRVERTPSKSKRKAPDTNGTPDKQGTRVSSRHRFGRCQKHESINPSFAEACDDSTQLGRGASGGVGMGNGSFANAATPRSTRAMGRTNSTNSESNSTQNTPTRSVSKPPNPGFSVASGSRFPANGCGGRTGHFSVSAKGFPIPAGPSTIVPHFDLKEDPSFWIDRNVQVIIRVRPLNFTEKSMHGYSRCLKQESAQSITWIGQPETRFTFDHVACETVDQELLFKMVGLPMVENCLSGYNSCMFAYGQTGSGKTYTMLGEMDELEIMPSPHRGLTARVFEFLFSRIRAQEKYRADERLKYSCKCSFLEIYNEQITDLLDPSSTNLLLREDVKKGGVYVENLSEFEVQTVSDILRLLAQGSSNRKVAATNMNRESSRSHSVFTCVIESRWEKDASANLRFARLNLVDLAGSERQKTSGAEGERLREAANINKSLSTLGHVIMVLVDVANGRPKHVPYRDSRLTFLLQDSLGGNSKTIIIANVSPSIGSAAETLNTLKFAQRAKLIQNNAVINEDSSGDVIALQHQIRLLKEELAVLKREKVSRSLSFGSTTTRDTQLHENVCREKNLEMDQCRSDGASESKCIVKMPSKQLKSLETTLAGALRREQMAEASIKQLEAEIEQLNRLVRQREEDTRSTKMMLKFREDKIQRMESLVSGLIPVDTYLLEENKGLHEEIQLVQAKMDRNPEVTRFALENIRLLDQVRRFQDFYEEGERETLLAEVSQLRDEVLRNFDEVSKNYKCMSLNTPAKEITGITSEKNPLQAEVLQNFDVVSKNNKCMSLHTPTKEITGITSEKDSLQAELKKSLDELEQCRINLQSCLKENSKLSREIDDLNCLLNDLKSEKHDQDGSAKPVKEFSQENPPSEPRAIDEAKGEDHASLMTHVEVDVHLLLELDILKIMLKEEKSVRGEIEEKAMWLQRDLDIANEKVMLTTRQCQDIKDELKEANTVIQALESQQILSINDMENLRNSLNSYVDLLNDKELEILSLKKQNELQNQHPPSHIDQEDPPLQKKLKLMQESLEKAKRLNMWYQSDRAFQASNEEEMDEVRKQVEVETAEVIVCLQEELVALQQQVENSNLKETESKNRVMLLETELIELQEKLVLTSKENETLGQILEEKNEELRALSREWEKLTCEIDDVLVGGHEALDDAADQLGVISSLLPQKRTWICEQFAKMARLISEKDLLIEELNISFENLSRGRNDVESMLRSLKGAAKVITEAHQQECSEKEREISLLTSEINSKTSIIEKLERRLKLGEDQISQTSICATAAFIIVNRLSEINTDRLSALRESSEVNLKKDGLLHDQATMIEEAKRQTENLRLKLSAEQQLFCDLEQKLEDTGEDDSLKIMDKLAELKSGISALRLHISKCAEQVGSPEEKDTRRNSDCTSTIHNCEEREDIQVTQKTNEVDMQFIKDLEPERCIRENISVYRSRRRSEDSYDVDLTIRLLRKEIETSIESIKAVQDQITNVRDEKENIWMIGEQRQKDKESLAAQAFSLQAAINNFEKLFQLKMVALNHKLQNVELNVQDVGTDWRQMKEVFELEIEDANMIVAQKSSEACCILRKFEENQETVREADIMINKLLTANGTMKLEIDELKKTQYGLILERNEFVSKIQHLQSSNDLKVQQCEELEKQLDENLMEMRSLFWELEGVSAQVQVDFTKDFKSLSGEFHWLKSQLLESKQSLRSWLEDIWSEIIVKDCAVSALHSCHMGILLETVIGLNAENSFLHHGLRESNSAVADLRERNAKSRTELEMCMILKGKLLADIKSSFDHISRKVDETGVLDMKLTSFEKKIMDLQLQEELMLRRFDYMGSQLAILTKELDMSSATSLLDQEKLLRKKEEDMEYETESFMINFLCKDLESVIMAFALKEALQKAERQQFLHSTVLENLKKQIIFLNVDAGFKGQVLEDTKLEVAFLRSERQDLFSNLSQISLKVSEGDEINKVLENEIQMLNDVASLNENLKGELDDAKARLSTQAQIFNSEREKYVEELSMKEMNLELCSNRISLLGVENEKLRSDIQLLEASIFGIRDDLGKKDAELSKMMCLEVNNKYLADKLMCLEAENKSLAEKNTNLETESCSILQDLAEKESEAEISLSGLTSLNMDKKNLQDEVSVLEKLIANLQTDLELRNAELAEFVDRQSVIGRELSLKSSDIDFYVNEVNALMEENGFLKSKLSSLKHEVLTASSVNITECIDSLKSANMVTDRMVHSLTDDVSTLSDKMLNESFENLEKASHFMEELQCLEYLAEDLISENLLLRTELSRKEDVLKGLSFDLRLLQESASIVKDQRDEVEDMAASLEALEGELSVKSGELNEVVAHGLVLQAQLQDKADTISALRLELSKEQESLNSLSCKNHELRAQMEDALAEKNSTQEKLTETSKINDRLAIELLEMGSSLEQMNNSVASLNRNLNAVVSERDQLQAESRSLKKELEEALSHADENEAIAVEAQQMAEARRVYVEEKEFEVKLLERSVEELESTVDVLEQKVDIVKGEAELQRLQREELELELDAVKHQLTNVESGDRDINRLLLEKEKVVQAQERIQFLEREIAGRDAEIVQCNAHISELHLHAEAQASEYKQKLKALEAMADQVRAEGSSSHAINSSSNKLEKNTSRPRGSGSPFKCIGLGLNHQIKSEKDEELTVGRLRIAELEALVVSRQKEIFLLNGRLAAAESMTHDVIRDLLGVKLDMTNYVSVLNNQQLQKMTNKVQIRSSMEAEAKEVRMLKQQLDELIAEKQGWLEEINQKQAAVMALQVSLEQCYQKDRLLTTEIEMIKMENMNHKRKVMELESDVKKLSGQQNIQQRIHHHAKIKEENHELKTHNEDLSAKLRRAEAIHSRVKDELALYRLANGRCPYIDFDEEQKLSDKLKETEEERLQLAQKLLGMCNSILKAAGIEKQVHDDTNLPEAAEEALKQLDDKIVSLEREVWDLKFKNRISSERVRLSEMQLASSPLSSRRDDNYQTSRKESQPPFLPDFDR